MVATVKLARSLARQSVAEVPSVKGTVEGAPFGGAGSLVNFTLDEIKDEARHLVERKIDSHQPICVLCEFIPPREWICAECELERNDYLLRDHICDLLAHDEWSED